MGFHYGNILSESGNSKHQAEFNCEIIFDMPTSRCRSFQILPWSRGQGSLSAQSVMAWRNTSHGWSHILQGLSRQPSKQSSHDAQYEGWRPCGISAGLDLSERPCDSVILKRTLWTSPLWLSSILFNIWKVWGGNCLWCRRLCLTTINMWVRFCWFWFFCRNVQ